MNRLTITIWNEYRQEQTDALVQAVYPDGIHAPIADHLRALGHTVHIATLDDPEHGLSDDLLAKTDVMIWWGHRFHHLVDDAVVQRVHDRVTLGGMGLIALHSAHFAKIFCALIGTTGKLKHAMRGERERIWCVNPSHPIATGLPERFDVPKAEMFGEFFDIPTPDELVFISAFEGGELFRSGCCWRRGRGKLFYFRPGHETFPIYYQPEILRVISNAVQWAAPSGLTHITYGKEGRDW